MIPVPFRPLSLFKGARMTRCEPALGAPRAKHGQVSSPRRAPFQKRLACRLRNSQVGGGQVSSLRDTEPPTALAPSLWPFWEWKGASSCHRPSAGLGRKPFLCATRLGLATPGRPLHSHNRSWEGRTLVESEAESALLPLPSACSATSGK